MLEVVVLGIGSNLGSRFENCRNAVRLISQSADFNLLGVSAVYETEPWGFRCQTMFINCVAAWFFHGSAPRLLSEIKSIERKLGRVKKQKWQPRIIDLDILFFGDKVIRRPDITVPHPLLHQRNFVLKPLMDLIPDFKHPVLKKSVRYLLQHSRDKSKVRLFKTSLI